MAIPAGGGRRPPPTHHAQAINLTTGTHVDSRGAAHKTHPGNRAHVGPHTMVFVHDQPPRQWMDHARHKTAVHKRMTARGNPHPDALMGEIMAAHPLGGIPAGRVG